MARIKVRYFVEKPGANGRPRFFWQPSKDLRRHGFQPRRLADDRALAIEEAERRNEEVDRWRADRETVAEPAAPDSLAALIADYRTGRRWHELEPKTRRSYEWCFGILTEWAGDAPVAAIDARRIERFHEALAVRTPAKANAAVRVLRLLLEHARRSGTIAVNPAIRPRLADTARKGRLWSREAIAAFVAAADAAGHHSIGTAVLLNEWLGQREGDLLALPRNAWKGGELVIEQSKTGATVALPLGMVPHLVARLEAELARQAARKVTATTLLVCETTGRPWREDHFRHVFAKIRAIAAKACPELVGLWFQHFRHTAVTRLAEAECELPMIAAITGHSLATVAQIVDRYLIRTRRLARAAFARRIDAERKERNEI